jgi:hypothetical protein
MAVSSSITAFAFQTIKTNNFINIKHFILLFKN